MCGVIIGGINYGIDKEILSKNFDIFVVMLGCLFEYIEKEVVDCCDIECLIFDEVDCMLDMGFLIVVN